MELNKFKAMTTAEEILDALEEIASRMLAERGIKGELEAYNALQADPENKTLDSLWRLLSIAQSLRTNLAAETLNFDEIVRKASLLMLLASEIAGEGRLSDITIH